MVLEASPHLARASPACQKLPGGRGGRTEREVSIGLTRPEMMETESDMGWGETQHGMSRTRVSAVLGCQPRKAVQPFPGQGPRHCG